MTLEKRRSPKAQQMRVEPARRATAKIRAVADGVGAVDAEQHDRERGRAIGKMLRL